MITIYIETPFEKKKNQHSFVTETYTKFDIERKYLKKAFMTKMDILTFMTEMV